MKNIRLHRDNNEGKIINEIKSEFICKVNNASREIMLYRVCNGNKLEFPFCN